MRAPLIFGSALILSAAAATAQGIAPGPDTLVIAQSIDAPTLDPAEIGSRNASNIADHIFGTLYSRSAEGGLTPELATGYEEAEDGLSITYKIHDGLTCQDGATLDAEDVAYSFNRAADPELGFTGNTPGYIFSSVGFTDAEVIDPLTVKINFDKVNPIAAGMLTEVYILCKDSYEGMSKDEASQNPVGSGPYRMTEWVKDDHITLERWDDYALDKPAVKTIVWRVIPEASTRTADLMAGNVDIITNVSPDQVQTIDDSGAAKVQVVSGLRRIYVGMNLGETFADTPSGKAFADPKVRHAVQYAVDVPTICDVLLNAPCTRATGPVNPPNDNTSLDPIPYDPDMAEKLLDEAGYPRGDDGIRFSTTLQVPNGRYLNDVQVGQAIGQYLSDIGIETTVDVLDFSSVYVPLIRKHEAGPMFLLGSGGATFSPLSDLMDFSAQDAGTNYTDWKDDEFFGKWKDIAAAKDPAEQKKIVDEMLKIFYDRGPWLMLYFQPDFYGVSDRITWDARRDERIDVSQATIN